MGWSYSKLSGFEFTVFFFFFKTGYLIKAKELSLPNYFCYGRKEKTSVHAFIKDIGLKGNAENLIQDLNLGHQMHFPQE